MIGVSFPHQCGNSFLCQLIFCHRKWLSDSQRFKLRVAPTVSSCWKHFPFRNQRLKWPQVDHWEWWWVRSFILPFSEYWTHIGNIGSYNGHWLKFHAATYRIVPHPHEMLSLSWCLSCVFKRSFYCLIIPVTFRWCGMWHDLVMCSPLHLFDHKCVPWSKVMLYRILSQWTWQ